MKLKLRYPEREFNTSHVTDVDSKGNPLGCLWFRSKERFFGKLSKKSELTKLKKACENLLKDMKK